MRRFLIAFNCIGVPVCIILIGFALTTAKAASPEIAKVAAALGLYPGMTRTFPQVQMTLEYVRTEPRGNNEYAVIVRRVY